jgi:Uma2 family endonuclease
MWKRLLKRMLLSIDYDEGMGAAALVSVEEYLSTSYDDADWEYVDGEVLERNLGEIDHSDIQGSALFYLRRRYKHLAWVGPEVRVQVKARRFRVPDVSVVLGPKPAGRIVKTPPFIAIEVLSPEDRADRMQTKIADYLEFGVQYIWLLDPETKTAIVYTRNGITAVTEGVLRTAEPVIELPLAELFQS